MARTLAQVEVQLKDVIKARDKGKDFAVTVRLMIGWCELRTDFRSFRTDRVTAAEFLEERYPERPATLRARYRRAMNERMAARGATRPGPAD